jgi:DNA-binding transcriptional LysR family regulator
VVFHDGITRWLDMFQTILLDCQRPYERVIVQGGQFSTLWLLPRVLRLSSFLAENPNVELEVTQGTTREFIAALMAGRVHIGLGAPLALYPEALPRGIAQKTVLTFERAVICHKEHPWAQGDPEGIRLEELGKETVFMLSKDTIPRFNMQDVVSPPQAGGRRIYVESVSFMYSYVQQNLGVAIGYEADYGIRDIPDSPLRAIPFVKGDREHIPPVEIVLYWREGDKHTQAVRSLLQAIQDKAPNAKECSA